ncbi:MAG TPA: nucleotidyltransferase family protein [Gemmatimonadaceae bacterium]
MTTRAVILARGLGRRMREEDSTAPLAQEQAAAADTGLKGMIPIGRPFLDYVLSALADAGFSEACLVIGPEHQQVREHYEQLAPTRIRIVYAEQPLPLGTADAVLAAEEFAAGQTFVVINSDNYYPPTALRELHGLEEPAIVAFEQEALVREGNAPRERVSRFGALEVGADGYLIRIVGDPERARASTGGKIYASMNCWLFDHEIFRACRAVAPSPRGELELTRAVQLGIDHLGMRFRVIFSRRPVLDLSSRADIVKVAERLSVAKVRL